jgi:hypothetical protein
VGWVKLDDGFPTHPKVVRLSLEARWAYIESLCYAAKYETDGLIPDVVAANGPVREELLAAGLWESGTAAVQVHDFLIYNPSRTEKERKRNASRTIRASREGAGLGSGEVGGGGGLGEGEEAFAAFWAAYPRRVGKPKARTAFLQAIRHVSAEAIIAGAKRYAEDPNRSDEFTAHPTTWIHRDGWEDAPLPARGHRQAADLPLDRVARRAITEVMNDRQREQRGETPGNGTPRQLPG